MKGRYVQHLVPVESFKYNLPVRVVEIEPRYVPACHECAAKISLDHLPKISDTPEWKAMIERKKAAEEKAGTAAAKTRTPKPTPTLDDIL